MVKSFDTHDWENDNEWKQYLNNLHFPSNVNREQILFKFQQKYYKNQIDPEYEPREYKPSSTSTSSSSSTSTSTHQRTSNTSSSSPNQQSQQQQQQQNTQQPQPQQQARSSTQYSQFLYISWIIAQVAIFLCSVLFLVSGNSNFFYRAFLASIISYSIPLFQTYEGTFNRERLIDTALKNENAHFLMFGLMMYFLGPASLIILMPNLTYSVFHLLNVIAPKVRNQPMIHKYVSMILASRQKAIEFAVQMEIFIFPVLLFNIFRGASPICVFSYYRFLKLRYTTNTLSRLVFTEFGRKIDQFVNTTSWLPPFIGNAIIKVKAFVSQ